MEASMLCTHTERIRLAQNIHWPSTVANIWRYNKPEGEIWHTLSSFDSYCSHSCFSSLNTGKHALESLRDICEVISFIPPFSTSSFALVNILTQPPKRNQPIKLFDVQIPTMPFWDLGGVCVCPSGTYTVFSALHYCQTAFSFGTTFSQLNNSAVHCITPQISYLVWTWSTKNVQNIAYTVRDIYVYFFWLKYILM